MSNSLWIIDGFPIYNILRIMDGACPMYNNSWLIDGGTIYNTPWIMDAFSDVQ